MATGYLDLEDRDGDAQGDDVEHQVLSVLETLLFTAMPLVMALHWPQTQQLFGFGHEADGIRLGAQASRVGAK
jgi:hypothetical protein